MVVENEKIIISKTPDFMQQHKWGMLLGSVGFASGIAYAFAHKTGFWKGWGIAIVFGIGGRGIGYGIDQFNKK